MSRHEELIARLEASSGDRELDAAIAVAIFVTKATDDDLVYARERALDGSDATHPGHYFIKSRSGASCRTAPAYTSDINLALTLVPEDATWSVGNDYGQPFKNRNIFRCDLNPVGAPEEEGYGTTPAISICIAALRARASLKARTAQK